jgi:hypothetical protein
LFRKNCGRPLSAFPALALARQAGRQPGIVCRNPGIFGTRFSSDAGASPVLANVSSLGKGCLMQKINR